MMDNDEFVIWVQPYMQRLARQIHMARKAGAFPAVFLPVGTVAPGSTFWGCKVYAADVKVPMVGLIPDVRDPDGY